VMPKGVDWIRASVTKVDPEKNQILLNDQRVLPYVQLIVAPGLVLDWEAIQGLKETLGKNGVTSNYDFEHAQYTWKLVKNLKTGKAIFTQPPMPIKCAGAPQKPCTYHRATGKNKKN
jgi:sulfide:quinone oxidoreductase